MLPKSGYMGEKHMGKPAPSNQPHDGHPEVKPQSASPAQPEKKKNKPDPAAGLCCADGCKGKSKRFSFCDEHYQQFKFGLITKEGDPAADYDRKYEHYQAYKLKLSKSVKVA